jgi:hypothetical protein
LTIIPLTSPAYSDDKAKKWGQKNLRSSYFCPHVFAFPFPFAHPFQPLFFIREIRAIRGRIDFGRGFEPWPLCVFK